MVIPFSQAHGDTIIKPIVSSRAFYDNNPQLRTNPSTEVAATVNTIQVDAAYRRPAYQLSLNPKVRLSRYTEETELNSEDYFVNLSAAKFGERNQYTANFDYERESTITTEQTDSGIFNVNLPRTTFSFDTSWQLSISESLVFSVFGNALDVSFEKDPRSTFVDYLQFGAGTFLSYQVTNRTSIISVFNATEFKTPENGTKTRSYVFQFGFDHDFDESTSASFRVGHNVSQIDYKSSETTLISLQPLRIATRIVDASERSSGPVTNFALTKDFSRGDARFEWSRSFLPSSQGARQETEDVRGFGRYRIGEHLDVEIRAEYRRRTQEGQFSIQRLGDLEYLNAAARLLYYFSPTLRAELGIRYRTQKPLSGGERVESERLLISLRYSPEAGRYHY